MSAEEIASHLIANCRSLKLFEAYMFGSTLRGGGQDVDILIVGPAGEALARLKKEIASAGEKLPLHVLYMDQTEALETDFIARERCVLLSNLASSGHVMNE